MVGERWLLEGGWDLWYMSLVMQNWYHDRITELSNQTLCIYSFSLGISLASNCALLVPTGSLRTSRANRSRDFLMAGKTTTKLFVAKNGPFGTPCLTPEIPLEEFMWVPFFRPFPRNEAH